MDPWAQPSPVPVRAHRAARGGAYLEPVPVAAAPPGELDSGGDSLDHSHRRIWISAPAGGASERIPVCRALAWENRGGLGGTVLAFLPRRQQRLLGGEQPAQ